MQQRGLPLMHREAIARAVSPRHRAGFSLIELMVVLLIFGLLLGTVIAPLVVQFQVREVREAESALGRVREALIGFAQAKGRLPCPDKDLDGVGDPVFDPLSPTTPCDQAFGTLPWQELGVAPLDRWGRVYHYRVSSEFTFPAVPGAVAGASQTDLTDSGDIVIQGDRDTGKSPVTITTTAAAVVVSTGANGHCGTRIDGSTLTAPDDGARWSCGALTGASAVDEFENVNDDATFVDRQRSEGGSNCDDDTGSGGPLCAFDDILVWVPTPILLGKLIEAGQLP
jgi:prepilin-type N-terminal cleavage/methylation domain-containing protein